MYTVYMNKSQKLEDTLLQNFIPLGKDKVAELQIIDTVIGDGQEVPVGATITAHYTGALAADGTIFQSSHDFGEAITFGLNQVIAGWTKGVPGMKVGGTRRLVIPATQAYGSARAAANIPPNSDLVFDIELVAVK
jgi:FKBP-type peptidyl-prolyl cis-trans isomerase